MKRLLKFARETDGQDLIEYALLAATISITVIAAMRLVSEALNHEYTTISASISPS
jgi:Flp pilus assembly pilin Flp